MTQPHQDQNQKRTWEQEAGRTPGQAEGRERDLPESVRDQKNISGPKAAERENDARREPKRTPGKAEG